jgi:cellulose synthase/poly-beta-1,6-N-acetylglucosamine synthase-like glycosyltransferase
VKTISQCLDSVLSLDYPKDRLEVYVIDAFSDDGTQDILQEYQKKHAGLLRVIEADLNVPQAYNMLLKEVKGEFIGFLDGDAVVDRSWLKVLVPFLDSPQVGGGGGIVLTLNEENRFAQCVGYELQDRFERMPKYCTRFPTDNFLVRKDILQLKFDEELDTGYDADMCYSIVNSGLKIVYVPDAIVYHYHRDSVQKFFKQQFTYGFNAIRLYIKHFSFITKDTKTRKEMFFQPPIMIIAFLFFLLGLFWRPLIYISLLLTASLLIFYFVSAVRLATKFKDPSSIPYLSIIYLTRVVAWTIGGVYRIIRTISTLLHTKLRGG